MAYEVFARKYRPKTWDDVVGQEATVKALRRAVATGRTASVYLFAGSHGVGKTSIARILAKSLDCPRARDEGAKDGAPCGVCDTCTAIERGECLDVVEIDAASHRSVDDAERLRENVRYKPASCAFKVYILDEVHQLSRQAFDALLKTFEEAPPLVRFILATTELHKVPSTILGRAQVFRFRRAGLEDVTKRLAEISAREGLTVEPEALASIARRARGSLRDSQKLLDQVVALAEGKVAAQDVARLLGDAGPDRVARSLAAIAAGDAAALLGEVAAHVQDGGRLEALAQDLLDGLRGVLYLKVAGRDSPLVEEVALPPEDLAPAAGALSEEAILFALQLLEEATQRMRQRREPRVVLEGVLVRLSHARELKPVGEVLARLERLEARLTGPDALRSAAPAPAAAGSSPRTIEARASAAASAPPAAGGRSTYGYPKSVAPRAQAAKAESQEAPAKPAPPAAAPGPTAASPVIDTDLEKFTKGWQAVLARVAERGVRVRRLFEASRPVAFAEGKLLVHVDLREAPSFLAGDVDRPDTREALEAAVLEALGFRVEARIERGNVVRTGGPSEGAGPPEAQAPRARSIYDEPIVRFAQRELGGQLTGD